MHEEKRRTSWLRHYIIGYYSYSADRHVSSCTMVDKVATSTRQKLDSCFVCGGERRKISREPSVCHAKSGKLRLTKPARHYYSTLLICSTSKIDLQIICVDIWPFKKSRNLSMIAIKDAIISIPTY